jgi:predicted transcriptional regulator
MKTVPEPNAELLSIEDVKEDVKTLDLLLKEQENTKELEYICERPTIREMLNKLMSNGICRNEEEAIERALKTFITAVIE